MDAVEKVARAVAGLDGVEYDAAQDFDQMDYRGKARELLYAFPQLALEGREEERWFPVHVTGAEWAARSKSDAEDAAAAYPRDWTFSGEESEGPNGIDHIRGERRTVWESPWSEVQS